LLAFIDVPDSAKRGLKANRKNTPCKVAQKNIGDMAKRLFTFVSLRYRIIRISRLNSVGIIVHVLRSVVHPVD